MREATGRSALRRQHRHQGRHLAGILLDHKAGVLQAALEQVENLGSKAVHLTPQHEHEAFGAAQHLLLVGFGVGHCATPMTLRREHRE